MKKIIPFVLVIAVAAWAFVYYKNTVKPTDVIVATDTLEGQTETNTPAPTPAPTTQDSATPQGMSYSVVENSVIWWKATKAGGFHTGTVNIKDGFISIASGMIAGWEFTLDMPSIKVLDISDEWFEKKLRDDFFESQTFPTSKLVIKNVTQSGTDTLIGADLTIKGTTNAISFPIQMTTNNDGSITITTKFAIDRMLRNLDMRKGMVNNFLEYDIALTFAKAL